MSVAADLIMPSKLTDMLASSRLVVAAAHDGTKLMSVLSRCGLAVPPEDVEAFAYVVGKLAADPGLRAELGKQARFYSEENIDLDAVLDRLEKGLLKVISRKSWIL